MKAVQPGGSFTENVSSELPATVTFAERSTVPPPVATRASAGCVRSICSHFAPARSTARSRSLSVNAFGFGRLATRSASVKFGSVITTTAWASVYA